MAANGHQRIPSFSPKRRLGDMDRAINDRPLKKRSPSPPSMHSSSSSSSASSKKRSREDSASADDVERLPKRRSPTVKQESPSKYQRSPSVKVSLAKKTLVVMAQVPSEEESKIVLSLANQLAFPKDEDDDDKLFAKYRAQTAKRKEAHKVEFEAQLKAKQKMLEESLRLREDKTSKKKRLAAARRKQEIVAHEKRFKEAKDDYNKYLETLRKVGEVRISEDEDDTIGGRTARGRAKLEFRVGERELLFPTPTLPFIANLSDEWEGKVVAALGVRSEAAVLAKSIEGVELSRKDIGRLLPPGQLIPGREPWLNDEVINAWYANLCARLNEKDGYVKGPSNVPKWVAYSTAWYKNATERGAQSIATWSRRKGIKNEKLLQTERIFFPTNSGAHWTLLTISGKSRTIEYLDSLNEHGYQSKKYINLALSWLKMELGSKFVDSEWTVLQTKSALQTNTNDCGVFACLNGLALVKGMEDPSVEFGSDDIPLGRRMFIATLLNGGFKGDFDL